MAKWGEGDPRWIVEERADTKNVNNWHWTEKNANNWSKDKLKSLLTGLKIDGAAGLVELKDFVSINGEASASNRKGKLIFFYEWELKINWTGRVNTEDMEEVSGTIEIPNLSEEQDICDIEVMVTVKDKTSGADAIKEMIRVKGAEVIRERLANYIDTLKIEFSQGMILPTTKGQTPTTKPTSASANLANEFKQTSISGSNSSSAPASKPVKIETKKISLKEEFMCSKEELYRALTEQNMVQAFTRSVANPFEVEVGGKFGLFNGMISGEFQQLAPHDTLVQRWRMKHWPEGHFSVVTIKLSQSSNCTTLTLSQTGVPSAEADRTKEGWKNYYWNSIRQTFGYAVNIF